MPDHLSANDDASIQFVELALEDERLGEFIEVFRTAFFADGPTPPGIHEYVRESWAPQRVTAAVENGHVVGTFRSWDWPMTVPGGAQVSTDAISTVTVLPTHRRLGAMSGLMRRDLDAAAGRGAVAASLLAARATIYPRFGFGPATRSVKWEIDTAAATLRESVGSLGGQGQVRMVSTRELRDLAPALFEAARRPGTAPRRDLLWDLKLGLRIMPGTTASAQGCLVHRDPDGVPQGFAVISWKEQWDRWQPQNPVTLEDLFAVTPQAYAELFRVLISLDNVKTLVAEHRPIDEPLSWMLTDHRALRIKELDDFLWVRILDVEAALSARTYDCSGRVVLGVRDPMNYAAGTYVVEAGPDGDGRCSRVSERVEVELDIELDVDVLSSLWLGDGDLSAAVMAGRAQEHSPGAAARLARMLRTAQAPWAPDWF